MIYFTWEGWWNWRFWRFFRYRDGTWTVYCGVFSIKNWGLTGRQRIQSIIRLIIGQVSVLGILLASGCNAENPCLNSMSGARLEIAELQRLSDKRLEVCDRLGLPPLVTFYERTCDDAIPVITGCGFQKNGE